jgi:hypothetical protein
LGCGGVEEGVDSLSWVWDEVVLVEVLDEVVEFVLGVLLEFFDAVCGDK